MTQLNNAVIIVTGASGGFGQQFTRQLLAQGSHLILTDIDEIVLRQKVKAIQDQVTTGKIIACWGIDLSTRHGCQTLYDSVKTLNTPVDILINNAGIALYGRMDEVPPEKWEQLMQVNLLTPMRLSSLFIADMIVRKKGHIVNISSIAGWIAPAGMAHYSTSKFGLRGLSEGLFNEAKPYNIKVTGVYPFFSRTPMLQAEQYGTLARKTEKFPEDIATDPAKVIERTIQAIKRNKLHVFPDQTAKNLHFLQQYFPPLVNWINSKFSQK